MAWKKYGRNLDCYKSWKIFQEIFVLILRVKWYDAIDSNIEVGNLDSNEMTIHVIYTMSNLIRVENSHLDVRVDLRQVIPFVECAQFYRKVPTLWPWWNVWKSPCSTISRWILSSTFISVYMDFAASYRNYRFRYNYILDLGAIFLYL